jgi:hypothetical protein
MLLDFPFCAGQTVVISKNKFKSNILCRTLGQGKRSPSTFEVSMSDSAASKRSASARNSFPHPLLALSSWIGPVGAKRTFKDASSGISPLAIPAIGRRFHEVLQSHRSNLTRRNRSRAARGDSVLLGESREDCHPYAYS